MPSPVRPFQPHSSRDEFSKMLSGMRRITEFAPSLQQAPEVRTSDIGGGGVNATALISDAATVALANAGKRQPNVIALPALDIGAYTSIAVQTRKDGDDVLPGDILWAGSITTSITGRPEEATIHAFRLDTGFSQPLNSFQLPLFNRGNLFRLAWDVDDKILWAQSGTNGSHIRRVSVDDARTPFSYTPGIQINTRPTALRSQGVSADEDYVYAISDRQDRLVRYDKVTGTPVGTVAVSGTDELQGLTYIAGTTNYMYVLDASGSSQSIFRYAVGTTPFSLTRDTTWSGISFAGVGIASGSISFRELDTDGEDLYLLVDIRRDDYDPASAVLVYSP